jgi:hypothetical protein
MKKLTQVVAVALLALSGATAANAFTVGGVNNTKSSIHLDGTAQGIWAGPGLTTFSFDLKPLTSAKDALANGVTELSVSGYVTGPSAGAVLQKFGCKAYVLPGNSSATVVVSETFSTSATGAAIDAISCNIYQDGPPDPRRLPPPAPATN